jgi:hypothetical protein
MIVAITGSRSVTAADAAHVERIVEALVYEVRPAEIIFGGATGVDTIALASAQHHRSHHGGTVRAHRSRLVVIVPDVVAVQPHEAREAIRLYADEVVELRQRITRDDGWAAYHARNHAMCDRATHVLGFWNGDPRSGTGACLAYAARIGRPLWVETIGGER